jgi:antirestriction protein ArdC
MTNPPEEREAPGQPLDQIDGIEAPEAPEPVNFDFTPIEAVARFIEAMPQRPGIIHAEPRAFYRPSTDTGNLPRPELFAQTQEYSSTAVHELTRATGHEKRLIRRPSTEIRHFGDREDSLEAMTAGQCQRQVLEAPRQKNHTNHERCTRRGIMHLVWQKNKFHGIKGMSHSHPDYFRTRP